MVKIKLGALYMSSKCNNTNVDKISEVYFHVYKDSHLVSLFETKSRNKLINLFDFGRVADVIQHSPVLQNLDLFGRGHLNGI